MSRYKYTACGNYVKDNVTENFTTPKTKAKVNERCQVAMDCESGLICGRKEGYTGRVCQQITSQPLQSKLECTKETEILNCGSNRQCLNNKCMSTIPCTKQVECERSVDDGCLPEGYCRYNKN